MEIQLKKLQTLKLISFKPHFLFGTKMSYSVNAIDALKISQSIEGICNYINKIMRKACIHINNWKGIVYHIKRLTMCLVQRNRYQNLTSSQSRQYLSTIDYRLHTVVIDYRNILIH